MSEQIGVMGEDKWEFDLIAEKDGIIAVMAYSDIRPQLRTHQKAVTNVLKLAAKRAFDVNYYNLVGEKREQIIKFTHSNQAAKKTRELFAKNKPFLAFMKGMEKEKRFLQTEMKT